MTESRPSGWSKLEVWLVSLFFLCMGIAIVLYGRRDWMPPLASKHGAGVDAMLTYLLVVTGTMLLIAFTALAILVWQGGRRTSVITRLARHKTELTISLALGLLMAAVAEGGVLAIGLPVWNAYFGAPVPPDALMIEVTAQQFLWNVRYPGPDGKFGRTDVRFVDDASNPIGLDPSDPATADDIVLMNQIVAQVNRPVHIRLRSKDMIHSFFLPNLRVKQDVIPGMTPEITFVPTKEGTFDLACAELCGLGHYKMQGFFTVVAPGDFERRLHEEAAR